MSLLIENYDIGHERRGVFRRRSLCKDAAARHAIDISIDINLSIMRRRNFAVAMISSSLRVTDKSVSRR